MQICLKNITGPAESIRALFVVCSPRVTNNLVKSKTAPATKGCISMFLALGTCTASIGN